MSFSLMYGCFQVETTVKNLNAARTFMRDVLSAEAAEQKLAQEIRDLFPPGAYDIDHLSCGNGLFQLNEPSPDTIFHGRRAVHMQYQERFGSCVTNLFYFVDDIAHAQQLLASLKAETHITGPSSTVPSLADYGAQNTRPGADQRPFCFIGARHLIGLDLEIMEPNFLRFTEQKTQHPCYIQPRSVGTGGIRMQRLRLVVPNLEETYRNIINLFLPGSRSKPYALREGTIANAFRIGLAGIELEYCEPLRSDSWLGERLRRYGPGVVTVEFDAREPEKVIERVNGRAEISVINDRDLLGIEGQLDRYYLASRDILGFETVIGKWYQGGLYRMLDS